MKKKDQPKLAMFLTPTCRHSRVSIYPLCIEPGPEVRKLFSCSTQLSMKFQLLIKTKIPTNKEVSCFKYLKYLRCCVYHANKC